jgi:hypothetical protein
MCASFGNRYSTRTLLKSSPSVNATPQGHVSVLHDIY